MAAVTVSTGFPIQYRLGRYSDAEDAEAEIWLYKLTADATGDTLTIPRGNIVAAFLSGGGTALAAASNVTYSGRVLTFTLDGADDDRVLDLLLFVA